MKKLIAIKGKFVFTPTLAITKRLWKRIAYNKRIHEIHVSKIKEIYARKRKLNNKQIIKVPI